MVAGAHGYPMVIEHGTEIVGVDAIEDERHHAGPLARPADQAQTADRLEARDRRLDQSGFMALDHRPIELVDVVERRRQADRLGRSRRAGLEPARRIVERRAFEGDAANHAAATLPWRHRGKVFLLPVKCAYPGGAVDLVAREREEVAVQLADIDAQMRRRLRAIDEHGHARIVRATHQLGHRQHRAECVRDVRESRQAGPRPDPA